MILGTNIEPKVISRVVSQIDEIPQRTILQYADIYPSL